jgi:predicted RNase H-like HicB family nuclease
MKNYQEFEINYFQDEDGHFTAEVPAIRGCVAWGKTLRETYQNAVDAIESCLEARAKINVKKLSKARYAGVNIYRRPVHA